MKSSSSWGGAAPARAASPSQTMLWNCIAVRRNGRAGGLWKKSEVNLVGDAAGKTIFERKDNGDYLLKG